MKVLGKHLSRRTLLRGLGTSVALPFLDAMTPARAAAPQRAPTRLLFVYVPNGVTMKDWTPATVGADFAFPRILKPLERFRDHVLVLSGLAHRTGSSKTAGDHARASGTYLTGVCPLRTTRASEVKLGISADQMAAQAIGSQTRFPSLELGCEATRLVGSCDAGYSCAYQAGLSWRSATTPLPLETNPKQVFERLYGSLDGGLPPLARARLNEDRRSVLDYVNGRARGLMSRVGPDDRKKLDEYLTALREIEQRLQHTMDGRGPPAPGFEKPDGVPTDFAEHVRLMQDLLVVALQADLTRVATLSYGRESSNRSYPELGFSDSHHPITHHRNLPDLVEKVTKINVHHVRQFADFIDKLARVQDGDQTLLYRSQVVYGSSLSEGNGHDHLNLPIAVLGDGNGKVKSGRHIKVSETPLTNLFLSLLDGMDVTAPRLGDSTGRLTAIG